MTDLTTGGITPAGNALHIASVWQNDEIIKNLEGIKLELQCLPEKIVKLLQEQEQERYIEKLFNSLEQIAHSIL